MENKSFPANETSAPIGVLKFTFPPVYEIMTDRSNNRSTDGHEGS